MKTCSKCHIYQDITEFYKESRSPDGTTAECKTCVKKRTKNWNAKNPEKKALNNKKWVSENLEKNRENAKQGMVWKSLNEPWKINASVARHRADKFNRTPKWLSETQQNEIKEFYRIAKELNWLSEGGLHVDHIVPLKGRNVSGLHVPWNLQVIPGVQNMKKSNKHGPI